MSIKYLYILFLLTCIVLIICTSSSSSYLKSNNSCISKKGFQEGFFIAANDPIAIASKLDSYKINNPIPNMTKNKLSIKTEGNLIDLIENMYNIVITGEEINSNTNNKNATTIENKISKNIRAMILLSKISSQALIDITKKDYNELALTYPNLIKAPHDALRLFEIFYASSALRVFFENPNMDNIDLNAIITSPSSVTTSTMEAMKNGYMSIYNSQLTILDAISEHIKHFHKKSIKPEKQDPPYSADDDDTRVYKESDRPTSNIIYEFPRTQSFPKKGS
jgi:hypothetical protein